MNDVVSIAVWVDHGADLLEFVHRASGLDVLWKNPWNYPPRRHASPQPHGGRSEFYDSFHGGWFTSLPNGFFPADYFGAPLGCHGELQTIAWEATIREQSRGAVVVDLRGDCIRTPWRLERELVLEAGASVVRWRDRLINRSSVRLPVAWLHHPGFGGSLIEGAEIVTTARTLITPPADRPELSQLQPSYRGAWPYAPERQTGIARDCSKVPTRDDASEHVVHLTDFAPGWAAVWNERRGLGFGLRWDEAVFPYAWSWAAGRGHENYPIWGACHTITIQPSTSPLLPFDELLKRGDLRWLAGGERLETAMAVGFFDARNAVMGLS